MPSLLRTSRWFISKRETLTKRPTARSHTSCHEPRLLRLSLDWKTGANVFFRLQQTFQWGAIAKRQVRDWIGEFASIWNARRKYAQKLLRHRPKLLFRFRFEIYNPIFEPSCRVENNIEG